jgi:type IV pilus biogenesis protein CpaD/CtpE
VLTFLVLKGVPHDLKWILISLTGLILLALIVACAQTADPEVEALQTETDTRALIVDRCSDCHSSDLVFEADYTTEAEWSDLIDEMIDKGADVSPEEKELMVEYLVAQE